MKALPRPEAWMPQLTSEDPLRFTWSFSPTQKQLIIHHQLHGFTSWLGYRWVGCGLRCVAKICSQWCWSHLRCHSREWISKNEMTVDAILRLMPPFGPECIWWYCVCSYWIYFLWPYRSSSATCHRGIDSCWSLEVQRKSSRVTSTVLNGRNIPLFSFCFNP